MRKPQIRFPDIAAELARINAEREALVLDAFAKLEHRLPALAQVLLGSVGSRQRAANWMCAHQRVLDGRTAYEVLGDGDEDIVWDALSGARGVDAAGRPVESRVA